MRGILLTISILVPCAAWANDNAKPIREFDLATTEKLGRAIYKQDSEAWQASDSLTEKYSRDELVKQGVHGWIVDELPDRDIVRFVRIKGGAPEVFYDVAYPESGPPTMSEPTDRRLNPEERAQYDARMLALKNVDRMCTDALNTVALRDPEGDGWLVWAMAATTQSHDVIIGGHYRFTISKDGNSVLRKDALSRGCLTLPKPQPKEGEQYIGNFVTHLVSLTPIETYVFDSLSYKETFDIGTLDGKAWKIEAGHINPLSMDAPGTDGIMAREIFGVDESCSSIVKTTIDGQTKYVIDAAAKVIESTEHPDKYPAQKSQKGDVVAISCGRNDIVPAPNDYKVLLAGYVLYITDLGVGHAKRTGALEISNGQLGFNMKEGDLDGETAKRLQPRIDAMQTAMQKKP